MDKIRLDKIIADRGLLPSRERAKAEIMAGCVYVNGMKAAKPGDLVPADADIEIRAGLEFVSRGGLKLKKAIEVFDIDLTDKVCMDCGASTGGFTDCMLRYGAKKVYSVDVGYGQLAWKLRSDPRVVVMEKTNVRYLTRETFPYAVDFATADLSFISLAYILPVMYDLTREDARCVCLIKPQFEAGRDKVGKKGVVRDPAVHIEVIEKVIGLAVSEGFSVRGLDHSPIRGPEGNIEYLLYLGKGDAASVVTDVKAAVERSHEELDKQ